VRVEQRQQVLARPHRPRPDGLYLHLTPPIRPTPSVQSGAARPRVQWSMIIDRIAAVLAGLLGADGPPGR
jgi:hypothetical protein